MSSNFPPGTRLGRYEIKSQLGAGGMGEVYLALDTELDRTVAIKILPEALASNQQRLQRFIQEAKAASALNHPHIITIHEIGSSGAARFIATEFIDGETLRQRIRNAPLKIGEAIDVAAQIASALSAAHAANIVHRDIKPENIMLRRDGIVKVLDFGLAKLTERLPRDSVDTEAPTSFKTDPGTVMGTAIYMSPEQARGLQVDARTDIFSLGVLIYEMVAARLPFEGANTNEILASILSEKEPPPLARYAREVPAELERILAKALRKEQEKRYQTTKDLLLDLQSLKQQLDFEARLERSIPPETRGTQTAAARSSPTQSHETAQTTPITESLARSIKQHKRGVSITLSVLLLAVGAGYWLFIRHSSNITTIESIAVLPFVNESGSSDVEYLSDGMTESLITSLSQLPKLSVKARSSVFRYKGKDTPPQQAGKELNVQAILTGRLVQHGNDLTLHIELVDPQTETALWSADYNRSMTNLVSLQGEIARDVSSKLRLKLSGADEHRLAKNYTGNAEAYQLYLKGRYHVLKTTRSEIQTSISYFQQAIDLDPSYALAYVGLADGYRALALGGEMPPTEFLPKAKATAQRAIETDDSLAEAHAELGFIIFWYDRDWSGAENQFKRALELDPNSADAHLSYAHLLSNTGRRAEALAEAKRARELDPLNLRTGALEGQFLLHAGRTDEALERLQKTFELDPNYYLAHQFASSAYIEKGMYGEAVAEAQKAIDFSGGSVHPTMLLGYALAKSGKRAEARGLLEGLLKLSNERYVPPYFVALIYNGLGERDEALAWLERAFERRDAFIVFLKVEPKWNNLREDPRFQDLLRRVGFSQQ